MTTAAIHWFRKCLRLHDNPALLEACKSSRIYPVFILDSKFSNPDVMGVNRYNFLLECLTDLDESLRSLGSQLYVVRGKAEEKIPYLVTKWSISLLSFESDYGPYARERDSCITTLLKSRGVKVTQHPSLTLHDPEYYFAASKGKNPLSYQSFVNLFNTLVSPRKDIAPPLKCDFPLKNDNETTEDYGIPSLATMGYLTPPTTKFHGGETEALKRLEATITSQPSWVLSFEKPNTSPNSLEPSTTVLSPYLAMGCISVSKMYHEIAGIYQASRNHSQPPVSLHGQLLWREFFYLCSITTPNFNKMVGNSLCKQIDWERNPVLIAAWREGRTGYPFIDAIMTQLRTDGWIHHLARHAVACFLTRGDLYQHWEEGLKVFEQLLLDGDYALNCANWQWLSCSRFFHQYHRVYSPIVFGKKTDPNGDYIRKWLPQLANFPKQYIFEPWTATATQQQQWGCVVGRDYPAPIVQHQVASKDNIARIARAYAAQKLMGQDEEHEQGELVSNEKQTEKKKRKPIIKAVRESGGIAAWCSSGSGGGGGGEDQPKKSRKK